MESVNRWISGICKDYPGIIPLGAMHLEHQDPEAESMWMRQPGIKGIKLHGDYLVKEFRSINGGCMKLTYRKVCIDTYIHHMHNIHIIHNV
jgi:hypothetical protein